MLECNKCYTYDLQEGEWEIGGLNIIGKLYVPPNHKSTLITPYVFVQGELEMSDTNPISKANLSMRIVLKDGGNKLFLPADSNEGVKGTPFNAGRRAFLVAGGKLTINGWDGPIDSSKDTTWTSLLQMVEGTRPTPVLSTTPGDERAALTPPLSVEGNSCPRQIINHDFVHE